MNEIKISCDSGFKLPIDEITPFQGNLKELSLGAYNRLKKEILETGFAFPIYVWQGPEGQNFCVGGHQRLKTLLKLREEGYTIPEVPVAYIQAKDVQEAKRRVLQDAAQYGKIESQGLYEFMHDAKIEIGDLLDSFVLPEMNLDKFAEGFFNYNRTEEMVKNHEAHGASVPSGPMKEQKEQAESTGGSVDESTGELNQEDFSNFDHQCPRCGFSFDDQP